MNLKWQTQGFVLFSGCSTAEGTYNLPQTAIDNGARSAMGYKTQIHNNDSDKWTSRFWQNLSTGVSINSAIRYANSFSDYAFPNEIKATREYGYIAFKPKSQSVYSTEQISLLNNMEVIDSKTYDLESKVISNELIANYVKIAFNENFDLNDYSYAYVEAIENENITKIYDFNLLINDMPSNVGYTVMVDKNFIQIINNLKSFDKQSTKKVPKVTSISNEEEEKLIKETVNYYKSNISENMKIEFESTRKHYDVNTNKSYLDINMIERDTTNDTIAIVTETFEI